MSSAHIRLPNPHLVCPYGMAVHTGHLVDLLLDSKPDNYSLFHTNISPVCITCAYRLYVSPACTRAGTKLHVSPVCITCMY